MKFKVVDSDKTPSLAVNNSRSSKYNEIIELLGPGKAVVVDLGDVSAIGVRSGFRMASKRLGRKIRSRMSADGKQLVVEEKL